MQLQMRKENKVVIDKDKEKKQVMKLDERKLMKIKMKENADDDGYF